MWCWQHVVRKCIRWKKLNSRSFPFFRNGVWGSKTCTWKELTQLDWKMWEGGGEEAAPPEIWLQDLQQGELGQVRDSLCLSFFISKTQRIIPSTVRSVLSVGPQIECTNLRFVLQLQKLKLITNLALWEIISIFLFPWEFNLKTGIRKILSPRHNT